MSMLAERKRKQKWTLNPRGKHWSEDTNKFGQKMLEKMGWSKGKGLGAQEQGITEHVRVTFKNDQGGIGFDKSKYEEHWTEHQTNFNDLLSQLQKEQNIEANDVKDETSVLSGQSLELKSQYSRARVHYKKFTRGKDVNKYSKKDLANIFGKTELGQNVEVKVEEEDVFYPIGSSDNRGGVLTINRGNMIDYFQNKMVSVAVNNNKGKHINLMSDSETELRVGFGFKEENKEYLSTVETEKNVKNFSSHIDNQTEELELASEVFKKTKKKKNEDKRKKNIFDNYVKQKDLSLRESTIKATVQEEQNKYAAYENPCLLEVSKIDNEAENVTKENDFFIENERNLKYLESLKKSKKKKHSSKDQVHKEHLGSSEEDTTSSQIKMHNEEGQGNKEQCFAFENPCLLDVNKIDNESVNDNVNRDGASELDLKQSEVKKSKKHKPKRKRCGQDSMSGNSETLKHLEKKEGNFVFENPCLLDINEIDNESRSRKKRRSQIKGELEVIHEEIELECSEAVETSAKVKRRKKKETNVLDCSEHYINNISVINDIKEKSENVKCNFVFENPCLLNINKIDSEAQHSEDVKVSHEEIDVDNLKINKVKKNKRKKKRGDANVLDSNEIIFNDLSKRELSENGEEKCNLENLYMANIQEIDNKVKKTKKRKKDVAFANGEVDLPTCEVTKKLKIENGVKKEKYKSNVAEDNPVLKEEQKFVFENPCLAHDDEINKKVEKVKKRNKKLHVDEISIDEMPVDDIPDITNKSQELKHNKENHNIDCKGFEVAREVASFTNDALDLTNETSDKKRVTFNDRIEYNTGVKKNKITSTKLDKYEVENVKTQVRNRRFTERKSGFGFRHTKKELKSYFYKSPVLEFIGSNINELKGYGYDIK